MVGLIAATTIELGYKTLVNVPGVIAPLAIFAAALVAQYAFKAKTTVVWVVFAAALAGLVLFR